ncbi:hypothetical protein [Pseudogemmobacter bohemicus]|uniref:hypothetical protein n=1 Tax=Pseudogemmobacter bohemicus TaxID=2250708 RepID=UPI001300A040|nr:hypothetical protein [Pseudogemmobacter bohemicus]
MARIELGMGHSTAAILLKRVAGRVLATAKADAIIGRRRAENTHAMHFSDSNGSVAQI